MPSSSKRLKLDDDQSSTTNVSIPASSNSGQSTGQSTVSPIVALTIEYKPRPKRIILTPSRKYAAKSIARGSKKAVAEHMMKDTACRPYIIECVAREVRKEIKSISSTETPSCFRATSPKDLRKFQWQKVLNELESKAPTLVSVLRGITRTRKPRKNWNEVVCMCAAIILKHHNSVLSLLQKLVTVILYAGHASKQTYVRLQKLNVCLSHTSMINMIDGFGKMHDAKVKKWKEIISKTLSATTEQQNPSVDSTTTNLDDSSGEDDYETDTDTYNSDSDYSWMSVSSISTANENSDLDSDCEMADVPIADVPMPPPSHDSETVSDIDSTSSESDCNEDDVVQKSY